MALLPPDIFQPPIPSLLLLIPPSSKLQWILRLVFLQLTILSIPLIVILVPLSVILPSRLAPLPIHPHNLPPYRSTWAACLRGWQVYIIGGLIWAVTGNGSAPDHDIDVSRRLTRYAQVVVGAIGRLKGSPRMGEYERMRVSEVTMAPFPRDLCVGVMAIDGLQRDPVIGFQLSSNISKRPSNAPRRRRAILWLTGGGYVTGYPLVDPILFSLFRDLSTATHEYTILGSNVRKSLSLDRAFPIPLLDALAGYAHLREEGYEAEDIVVMGNSAGSGLSWSLISYLAAIDEAGPSDLGIPGTVIMISPWLSLPPVVPSGYPDLIDEPQLLNAARCYLARFPILSHRPNPFQSDWYLWEEVLRIRLSSALDTIKSIMPGRHLNRDVSSIEKAEQRILNPELNSPETEPIRHLDWLEEATFSQFSSHHPFISPCSDADSPFVQHSLKLLARNSTRMLMHCGTAEWFYEPAIGFARAAKSAGMKVRVVENIGGLHVEGCVLPPDLGGAGAELQQCLIDFLDSL